MKIGLGYDVHRLVENRKLIIGGEEIAYSKGLLGHSDADVLIHAIMDSLLGAAGLGDIGKLFPDTDDKFKDVSSLILLEKVRDILGRKNHSIINIDTTIVAQEPKLSPYIDKMIKNIATSLKISTSQINIKATTEEGLGFTGTKEGIAAYSICLIS